MSNELLAKPSGITYSEHVSNVCDEGKSIILNFPTVFEKYQKVVGKDLRKRLNGACLYHDSGKKHPRWQDACQRDYQIFLDWQKENRNGHYKDFEIAVKGNTGPNLLKANIRHEIASLVLHKRDEFSLPIQVAIAAHHAKLSERHEDKWKNEVFIGESWEFWKLFKKENNKLSNFKFDFDKATQQIYEFSGVRSLLQLADHRASAKEANSYTLRFEDLKFSYKFKENWQKRPVQEIAEKHWNDELLLLRAPTGAGKTDAALLWAQLQIENKKADRLIFAMPTRFTSNALAISTASTLSETGLYHSSAWNNKFGNILPNTDAYRQAKHKHEYARLLLTPVTVCTIDHLLVSLTLTREDHHSVVFNLANSCVVIDEADFYDNFTQANILVLLRALKNWNVPVLLMSASLPESSLEMYRQIGFSIKQIYEDTSDNDRLRCDLKEIINYEIVDELGSILDKCIEKGNAIIYANTVDKAIKYYRWFLKKGIVPMIYHSRFTEPDKKRKEAILIKNLGKEAWEENRAGGIAILTQIGEMSINISADIMISDLCPIDRLMQRVGRLCRFDKNKIGELYVVIPQKAEKSYAYPYVIDSKGVYAYSETENLLKCKGYSANNFVDFLNQVYPNFENLGTKAEKNADKLKELFVANWLVGSVHTAKEDETENDIWKSRDIEGNSTVFIEKPNSLYFKNWRDFQALKNDNSIEIPRYLVEKGLKNHKIHTDFKVKINEEKSTPIYCLYPNVYSSDYGLIIETKEKDFEDRCF
jgi:CRISPR-associated endonuclease/helicase Cas3